MFDSDILIIIPGTGAVFLLVILLLLWSVHKVHPFTQNETSNPISPKILSHHDADILVQSRSLVSAINDEIHKLKINHPAQYFEQMTRNYPAIEKCLGYEQQPKSHCQDEQKRPNV
jgi:hypothetical protein